MANDPNLTTPGVANPFVDGNAIPKAPPAPVPSLDTSIPGTEALGDLGNANPSGGGDPNLIIGNIRHPAVNILPFLDSIARQAQVVTAATTYGDSYGAMSAAKPSPKPFIIGFIIPDVPINYIPVKLVKGKVSNVTKGAAGSSGASGPAVEYAAPGQPGLHQKQQASFSAADLKAEIISAYKQLFGKEPTEMTVALLYAQFALESGVNASSKSFSCSNYNLGNQHALGTTVPFAPPGAPRPKDSDLPPPGQPPPKGGSYFWTWDQDAKGGFYGVYMKSYDNLHAAVLDQVGSTTRGWPGTATAQTPEEFNEALTPRRHGNPKAYDYYAAPVDLYLRGLRSQVAAYHSGGSAGGPVTPSGNKPANANPKPAPTTSVAAGAAAEKAGNAGAVTGAIMDNGDVSGADDNPLDFQFGKHLVIDEQRKVITDAYVASIIHDIEILRATPPLLMMINPSTFERTYEASVDNGVKARQGHIVHMWLEKPLVITCKGVTAAHYILASDGAGGLAMTNRIQSISYQNLLSLVLTYKNNGIIYDNFSRAGNGGVPIIQMSLFIYYDGKVYIGSFDDLSVEDSADKPYNMEYNFKFTVRYEIEVDNSVLTDSSITAGL